MSDHTTSTTNVLVVIIKSDDEMTLTYLGILVRVKGNKKDQH